MYNLRVLPFGGFCKILGDGDPVKDKEDGKDSGNLKNKSKIAQMFVMLAGVTMNFLLAILLYTVFLSSNEWRMGIGNSFEDFKPVGAKIVRERVSDVPYEVAQEGGAKESEMYEKGYLVSINEEKIDEYKSLITILEKYKSEEVVVYACNEDGKECGNFNVFVNDENKLGIYTGNNYNVYIDYADKKVFSGVSHSINIVKLSKVALTSLISQAKETGDYSELSNTVSGPIGIYFIIDYFKTLGLVMFLGILADLSLSLAVINLFPLPALDGGRFFILLIESIFRKDLNKKVEEVIINLSFIFLVLFIVFIMIKDIINIEELKTLFK